MPNKNYLAGIRIERKAKAELELSGWTVLRTAGSHGLYDLCCVAPNLVPMFVQVKSTKNKHKYATLSKAWSSSPPMPATHKYAQELWVWYKGRWWITLV